MSEFSLGALRALAGEDAVLSSDADMKSYLEDWRGVFHGSAQAVVRPSCASAVADIVRYCAQTNTAVVPQGGNTGLAAGATPVDLESAIVLSLSRMREIRSVDAAGNTIAVDAGCVLTAVQEAAQNAERYFPLSLGAEGSAQIGGLIATNAGGSGVLRYGTMRGLVLGLEAVLPDGRLIDGMRALRKDNAGYDWKQLFIGSEGTLGIITGAVLRLFPKLKHRVTALVGLQSTDDIVRVFSLLQSDLGETLDACELFSDVTLGLRIEQEPLREAPMARYPWYLLVEAASSLPGLKDATHQALAHLIGESVALDCVIAGSPQQAGALWEWRESIPETERRAGRSAKHDVSVPVSSIPSFIDEATFAVESAYAGSRVLAFGHVGDGNVHFNVILPPGRDLATEVNAAVHEIVRAYRGSITAEHGIGRYRRDDLVNHRSAAEIQLMHRIKSALDPSGNMNPGAVLPRR
ncbi:MAG TPA: FAD-binding oxidoreductase [Candidatus Baltobacteraceae bacterium]|nr:FAD-binding oxidoreductase [Candidatus Baltobacteraceae bacterium]